jgi:hypothetical protein
LVVAYKVSNVRIYKGAALGLNANGHVVPMAHGTANLKFVGIANESVDNSSGTAGDKSINVTKNGAFVMKASTGFVPAIADLGKEVYAVTDWEVHTSNTGLTNQYKPGTIVAVESTSTGEAGVRVRIDKHTV